MPKTTPNQEIAMHIGKTIVTLRAFLTRSTFIVLPFISACGEQADAEYRGEALATVGGRVTLEGNVQPAKAEAGLLWVNSHSSPDTAFGQSVDVQGSFPAEFKLDLRTPPPDAMMLDYTVRGQYGDEVRVAVAHVFAVPDGTFAKGTNFLEDPSLPFIGTAEDHLVVYLDRDVRPGTYSEQFLGGVLGKGFHVMKVEKKTEQDLQAVEACQEAKGGDTSTRQGAIELYKACGTMFDQLRPAPQDQQTLVPVKVVGDVEALDFPEWT